MKPILHETCQDDKRVARVWERTCIANDDLEVEDPGRLGFDALGERLDMMPESQLSWNETRRLERTVGVITFAGSSMS